MYLKKSNLPSRLLRDQPAAILPWESPESSPFLAFFPFAPYSLSAFFFFPECIPLTNRLHSNPYLYFSEKFDSRQQRTDASFLLEFAEKQNRQAARAAGAVVSKLEGHQHTRVWEKWSCLHRISQWQGCRRGHIGTWNSSNCHKKKPTLRTSRMMDQERPSAAVVPQSQQIWWKWRRMWLPHIPPKCTPWTQTLLSDAAQRWEHQSLWK